MRTELRAIVIAVIAYLICCLSLFVYPPSTGAKGLVASAFGLVAWVAFGLYARYVLKFPTFLVLIFTPTLALVMLLRMASSVGYMVDASAGLVMEEMSVMPVMFSALATAIYILFFMPRFHQGDDDDDGGEPEIAPEPAPTREMVGS